MLHTAITEEERKEFDEFCQRSQIRDPGHITAAWEAWLYKERECRRLRDACGEAVYSFASTLRINGYDCGI